MCAVENNRHVFDYLLSFCCLARFRYYKRRIFKADGQAADTPR